jgi:hypothetical protein
MGAATDDVFRQEYQEVMLETARGACYAGELAGACSLYQPTTT